ncbi:trypsin-like peptidase domain-containing protein [Erythrobacter sp. NFXS35]|uniref:trypsin-like peptidase domain-containing protein n=1 Tax=Erythrobacter sp. NFXS35 TaxID=2818436 RepID=UPI0032DE4830
MKLRTLSIRPALAALLLSGSAIGGIAGGVALASDGTSPVSGQLQAPGPAAVIQGGVHASLADMVEAVGPSVVQIQVKPDAQMHRTGSALSREEMLRRYFGQGSPDRDRAPQRGSLGSGFIIDPSGLVVTNNHVVGDAAKVTVQLSDGRELEGRVLGRDAKTDVAVVQITEGGSYQAIDWGDSERSRVGDSVFAVGSPFGLGNTVTSGIVSALGREIGGPYDDYLQVDAAINSGNSGGPLFDAYGRVIGVNTAIFSPSGGNVGIGFAIPSHLAREVAMEIVANGSVARGQIGVSLRDLDEDLVEALGLPDQNGVLIAQVEPSGTAARSGLRPGDVVLHFGGQALEDGRDLARAVADAKAGSTVPVEIVRDGRRLALNLAIGSNAPVRS